MSVNEALPFEIFRVDNPMALSQLPPSPEWGIVRWSKVSFRLGLIQKYSGQKVSEQSDVLLKLWVRESSWQEGLL
jgi:hypothetical protein